MQDLVIATESYAEDDGRHVLEAVDPLLPLRPLAAHIKEPEKTEDESVSHTGLHTHTSHTYCVQPYTYTHTLTSYKYTHTHTDI